MEYDIEAANVRTSRRRLQYLAVVRKLSRCDEKALTR